MKVLHSICQQIWKTHQWSQAWKRSVFTPITKKTNAKESSNYCTSVVISHTSKVMLKILQARLQQYMNMQMFKLDLEKAEEPEIKLPTSSGSLEKREFQKSVYFWFIYYNEALTVWITINWKILKETGMPDHLTSLLKNLYAGQEATVRTCHGTTEWF